MAPTTPAWEAGPAGLLSFICTFQLAARGVLKMNATCLISQLKTSSPFESSDLQPELRFPQLSPFFCTSQSSPRGPTSSGWCPLQALSGAGSLCPLLFVEETRPALGATPPRTLSGGDPVGSPQSAPWEDSLGGGFPAVVSVLGHVASVRRPAGGYRTIISHSSILSPFAH